MLSPPHSPASDYSVISSLDVRSLSSGSRNGRSPHVALAVLPSANVPSANVPSASVPSASVPSANAAPRATSVFSSPPLSSPSASHDSRDDEYDRLVLSPTASDLSLASSLNLLSLDGSSAAALSSLEASVLSLDAVPLDAYTLTSNALRMPALRAETATPTTGRTRRAGRRQRNARACRDDGSNGSSAGSYNLVSDVSEDSDDNSSYDVASVPGTPRAGSVMSSHDARASIDEFFSSKASFTSDSSNRLRLYQALCIELGLVEMAEDTLPDLPDFDDAASSRSVTPADRSATPRPRRPPFPTTITQAKAILKATGHINIQNYIGARDRDRRAVAAGGNTTLDRVGAYAHLVYPSVAALRRASVSTGKIYPLKGAKHEWLEPLLRDFFTVRTRGRR
ncbi:hypothetical protein Q5752_005556 [Cryptotrichosporon argae]